MGPKITQRLRNNLNRILDDPLDPVGHPSVIDSYTKNPSRHFGVPGGTGGYYVHVISIPLTRLIAVLVLSIGRALYRERERRRMGHWPYELKQFVTRCGSYKSAGAALVQLRLARECMDEFVPDRPIETLADLRQCTNALIQQLEATLRTHPEAAALPELQPEVRHLLMGQLLGLREVKLPAEMSSVTSSSEIGL